MTDPLYLSPSVASVPGAWFDEAAVQRVIDFAGLCRHVKGEWTGPIVFEDWQLEHVIKPIFGWKDADGLRIVRTAWIELPRKNGKSTLATVLGLYLTGADGEPGAEVYAAAYDKDQARLVIDPARRMVESSKDLGDYYTVLRDNIAFKKTGSFFRAVSADYRGKHGYNVHAAIVDEVHVHRTRDLIDAIETGTGARRQPLVIFITTAGEAGEDSIYAEKHDYARKLADRILVDPSFHGVIYAASPGDDPHSEETWKKANPNYGISVKPDYIKKRSLEAQASPGALNSFLRFHLNIRTRQTIRWLPLDRWDACHTLVKESDLEGKRCYGGLVATRSQDINAFCLLFPDESGYSVLWRFWLPEERLSELDSHTAGAATKWAKEGFLTLTPGDYIEAAAIRNRVKEDSKRFDVREIASNRRGATQIAAELVAEGLEVTEVSPGIGLSAATEEWGRLILAQGFKHGGDPVARWMFDGLSMKQNSDGSLWPDSGASRTNISGPVAAVLALDRASRDQAPDLSEAVW